MIFSIETCHPIIQSIALLASLIGIPVSLPEGRYIGRVNYQTTSLKHIFTYVGGLICFGDRSIFATTRS